jgi:hypothetical protein
LQWFPPCEKRQRTQRELNAEYPAVVIGEEDPDPGRIVFIWHCTIGSWAMFTFGFLFLVVWLFQRYQLHSLLASDARDVHINAWDSNDMIKVLSPCALALPPESTYALLCFKSVPEVL